MNCKKRFLILLTFGCCFCINAQNFQSHIIGGVLATQIDGDDFGGYNKPGLFFGAGLSLPLSEKTSFAWDLVFIQKGSRRTTPTFYYLYRLSYLELPIYLNFKVWNNFSLQAGGAVGYLVNARFSSGFGFTNERFRLRKTDFSGLFGVSYELNKKWSFSARWERSIFSIHSATWFVNRALVGSIKLSLN